MEPSADCYQLTKQSEGLELKAYRCPSGKCTIGWGSTTNVCDGQTITEEEAERRLEQDLNAAAMIINLSVNVPLQQCQFDALTDFVFNAGAPAFTHSTLLQLLNQGNYDAVPGQLRRWIYGTKRILGVPVKIKLEGLVRRREAEVRLWSKCSYLS